MANLSLQLCTVVRLMALRFVLMLQMLSKYLPRMRLSTRLCASLKAGTSWFMMLSFMRLLRVLYITLPAPYIKSMGYYNKASTNYVFEETMTGARWYTKIWILSLAVSPKLLYMVGLDIKYGVYFEFLSGACPSKYYAMPQKGPKRECT